jgi:hypothetical protein
VRAERGNPDFLGQTHFTESECDTIKELVVVWGQMGFPFEMTTFAGMCQQVARAKLEDEKNQGGGDYVDKLVSN